jgi:hypothetical protein
LDVRSPLRRWCVETLLRTSGLDQQSPHRRRTGEKRKQKFSWLPLLPFLLPVTLRAV